MSPVSDTAVLMMLFGIIGGAFFFICTIFLFGYLHGFRQRLNRLIVLMEQNDKRQEEAQLTLDYIEKGT